MEVNKMNFETKLRNAKAYIEKGHKIKVAVRFKGRQMAHPEVGNETLNKFLEYVTDYATIEKKPVLDGRWLTCVLSSKVKK